MQHLRGMFGTKRRLRALEAQVSALQSALKDLDVVELERMRGSVLNALRALNRSRQAQDERTAAAEGSTKGDDLDRILRLRRGL